MIEWREGYTGGLASAYQSDHEGYINDEYKYAIQIYKDEITLYTVTYCDYHSCAGIWDYCDIQVSDDGNDSCEVGYCLTILADAASVEEAKELARKDYDFARMCTKIHTGIAKIK
jgi:hypothetical protein